jgi:hypothetical protein
MCQYNKNLSVQSGEVRSNQSIIVLHVNCLIVTSCHIKFASVMSRQSEPRVTMTKMFVVFDIIISLCHDKSDEM